jgi:hypothetical protein
MSIGKIDAHPGLCNRAFHQMNRSFAMATFIRLFGVAACKGREHLGEPRVLFDVTPKDVSEIRLRLEGQQPFF